MFVKPAPDGVVDHETVFCFQQEGNYVCAEYSGDPAEKGYITGALRKNLLKFPYCQLRMKGTMDAGSSVGHVYRKKGQIYIMEEFEMTTEGSVQKGVNIFKEIEQ